MTAVAISPDGETVASASLDKTLRFWDARLGDLKRTIANPDPLNAIAYLPDGRLVAATGSPAAGFVKIWDAATGRMRETWPGHQSTAWSVAVSADGAFIASGDATGTILVRNSSTGAVAATLKRHVAAVTALAFSPDVRSLASGSLDESLIIWDTKTWQPRHILSERDGRILAVAFSRDSKLVADGTQWTRRDGATGVIAMMGTVKMWDATTGKLKTKLPDHGHGVFGLTFSPQADLLAARSFAGYTADLKGSQDEILFWDSGTGGLVDKLVVSNGQAMSLAFSPDGRTLAAGEYDQTVRVWNVDRILAKRAASSGSAPTGRATGASTTGGGTTGLLAVKSAPDPPSAPTRAPRPGELDLGDGRFAPERWDISGTASIDAGALRFDLSSSGIQAVRATSRLSLSGDFDLRLTYSLEEYDARAGYSFEVAIVSRPADSFMLDPMQLANMPAVRVGRTGVQGQNLCFAKSDSDINARAVPSAGRQGIFRIQRRGNEWTVAQFDDVRNEWTAVGNVTRQLSPSVGIELTAARTGSAGLKMTARSLQVSLFGAK